MMVSQKSRVDLKHFKNNWCAGENEKYFRNTSQGKRYQIKIFWNLIFWKNVFWLVLRQNYVLIF